MPRLEMVINLDEDMSPEDQDRVLGALLARYDDEFGQEVEAILRAWADQTERYREDGSVNPRGTRSPEDYRRLADNIAAHRAHLATL